MKISKYQFDWGPLWVKQDNHKIVELSFNEINPYAQGAKSDLIYQELVQYFKGELKEFTVELNPQGTSFQKSVWNELLKIEHGTTLSYSQIAQRINNPTAVRAVGSAIGKNPIAIIIPCHRVINKDGRLGGYSGGIEHKIRLMEVEGIV
ncbi:MAG TPA: methylated-DNA--[protein]-cysteine S-methyltransferase [Erysipelothrix sp.]|nr:methylated-DNA--[protein]-cysteine S-methyltransferase [Erysipelothrix sp.]